MPRQFKDFPFLYYPTKKENNLYTETPGGSFNLQRLLSGKPAWKKFDYSLELSYAEFNTLETLLVNTSVLRDLWLKEYSHDFADIDLPYLQKLTIDGFWHKPINLQELLAHAPSLISLDIWRVSPHRALFPAAWQCLGF